jgi:hypothetical protein
LPGQLPQRLRTGRKIGDQGLFGDLDGQALGRKARVARAAQQAPGEIGQGKILGRDIEREPPCLGPALRAGHGRPGDMLRERGHLVGPLGHGEQRGRADLPDGRMLPAGQRLGPGQGPVAHAELRLVENRDLVAMERADQVGFEQGRAARAGAVAAIGPEQPPRRAALQLHERLIEPVEQARTAVARLAAQQRNARQEAHGLTHGPIWRKTVQPQGPGNRAPQHLRHPLPPLAAERRVAGDQELPARNPRDEPARAELLAQHLHDAPRHFGQNAVSPPRPKARLTACNRLRPKSIACTGPASRRPSARSSQASAARASTRPVRPSVP